MNKVIEIGRLTKAPELSKTQSGRSFCRFTIAVDIPGAKSRGAEKTAEFLNCVAWEKTAELLSQYCDKGSQIAIEGRLTARNYEDRDGKKRTAIEIVTERMEFVGSSKTKATDAIPMGEEEEDIPF